MIATIDGWDAELVAMPSEDWTGTASAGDAPPRLARRAGRDAGGELDGDRLVGVRLVERQARQEEVAGHCPERVLDGGRANPVGVAQDVDHSGAGTIGGSHRSKSCPG